MAAPPPDAIPLFNKRARLARKYAQVSYRLAAAVLGSCVREAHNGIAFPQRSRRPWFYSVSIDRLS
jgi:hypothetical protein